MSEITRFLSKDSNLWTPTPFDVTSTVLSPVIESPSVLNNLIVFESTILI